MHAFKPIVCGGRRKKEQKKRNKHQQLCDNYEELVKHAKYRKNTLISTDGVLFFCYHNVNHLIPSAAIVRYQL